MRKILFALILALMLPIGVSADVDLSGMSFDELVALRDQLNLAIWNSAEWQEVTVPQGVWEIGVDIPAGHWTLKCAGGYSSTITYGNTLDESGSEIPYSCRNRIRHYVHNPSSSYFDPASDLAQVDIEMAAGNYIIIESASVIFSPYSGKPDLGFGGSPVSYSTKPTPSPTEVPLVDGKYELFSFNKAARMPDDYKNTNVYLNGEVVQVLGSRKEGYTLRVSTSGSYGDVILVYVRSSVAPSYNILDDDKLYIKGYSGGEYTYESTVGTEITVPLVYADYVEILVLK